jgi:hypothetical protein
MYTGVGVLRLGFIVRFLSHSVITGFTSGAAIIIGMSQVGGGRRGPCALQAPRTLIPVMECSSCKVEQQHCMGCVLILCCTCGSSCSRHWMGKQTAISWAGCSAVWGRAAPGAGRHAIGLNRQVTHSCSDCNAAGTARHATASTTPRHCLIHQLTHICLLSAAFFAAVAAVAGSLHPWLQGEHFSLVTWL